MDTKEAIEFCEIHRWKNPRSTLTLEGFKDVEILLERGEKFELMWKELFVKEFTSELASMMLPIEEKYFPKEE